MIIALALLQNYHERNEPLPVLMRAVKPDHLLLNARAYIQESAFQRSHDNLKEAITEMEYVVAQADTASSIHINTGLEDLRLVEKMMQQGDYNSSELNKACVVALNALSYYQIKSAEDFIRHDMRPEAVKALRHGMAHVKNALIFAEGNKKDNEVHIYNEMNDIIRDDDLLKGTIMDKLDAMLYELEDLEVAYHH